MAVFFKNDCKYKGCGRNFPTLSSLIEHIETVHLNFDTKTVSELEQKHNSTGIPFSYVLRYSHCHQVNQISSVDIKLRLIQHASKNVAEKQNSVPKYTTEDEENRSDSESSNESWTPPKTIERKFGNFSWFYKDRPFACSLPGCKKRYKNINGLKYHYKNGHSNSESTFKRPQKFSSLKKIKVVTKNPVHKRAVTVHFPRESKPVLKNNNPKRLKHFKWVDSNGNSPAFSERDGNIWSSTYPESNNFPSSNGPVNVNSSWDDNVTEMNAYESENTLVDLYSNINDCY